MPGSLTPGTTANESPGPESSAGRKVASHLQDRCWIIPFVAACVTFLTTIIESNRGYLYVLFMEEYHADHATASWPGNILLSASHLSGFVIVLLQNKLSVFVIGLFVVALSAIAVIGGAFCPDMACMSVTVGGLYGLGYGASLTSFAIYTVIYFEKYVATATALKYAAWSASGLVGPSIVSLLVNYYGLPGTLLLIGAIMLNGLPLIMLIRHPRPLKLWCSPSLYKPKPTLSSPSGEHHDKTDHCAKQPSSPSSTAALSPLPKSINRLGLTAKKSGGVVPEAGVFRVTFCVRAVRLDRHSSLDHLRGLWTRQGNLAGDRQVRSHLQCLRSHRRQSRPELRLGQDTVQPLPYGRRLPCSIVPVIRGLFGCLVVHVIHGAQQFARCQPGLRDLHKKRPHQSVPQRSAPTSLLRFSGCIAHTHCAQWSEYFGILQGQSGLVRQHLSTIGSSELRSGCFAMRSSMSRQSAPKYMEAETEPKSNTQWFANDTLKFI
ncbi:uncharacterized protein LOC119169743 isoform X1 [Rhipicephalus microplus]|uniref:uncharacterized protein LOC119169743 isoform X1 n=1 Tax=Rhipicephalus microplus TaxID=6941 RepID=UPI003F6BB4E0